MPHHGEAVGGAAGLVHYSRILEPLGDTYIAGNQAPIIARVYLRPFQVEFPQSISSIMYYCGAGNGDVIQGVYADNGDTPFGGAVLAEHAALACVVQVQEVAILLTALPPGLYWLAIEFSDNTASFGRGAFNTLFENNAVLTNYYYNRVAGFGPLTDPCPAVLRQNQYMVAQQMRSILTP